MRLPFHIVQLLKEKAGSDLRLPSDCEFLSLDIESKTGVHIGATTLKRLVGFAHQTIQNVDRLVKEYPNIPETTIRQETESRFQSLVSSVFNQMREH